MPLYRDFSLFGSVGSESSTSSDSFGRLRSAQPFTLFDSSHRFADNGLWATSTATGGAASFVSSEGCVNLGITTSAGSEVIRETYRVFPYQPGKSILIMSSFVASTNLGIRQRIGFFGASNGIFLEVSDSTWSFVRRSQSAFTQSVDQSSWNVDKLDGTGPSRITLDKSKAHIFWTDLEWLGVGTVRCGFVINGKFVHCHSFHHANILPNTYITTACLPLRYEITNVSGTSPTPSTLKQVCSTVISEGGYQLSGASESAGIGVSSPYSLTTSGTQYPLMSVRLKSTHLDAAVVLSGLSVLSKDAGTFKWDLISNGTTSGGSWSSSASSCVEYNTSATSVSGGSIVASGYFSGTNQATPSVALPKDSLFKFQLERNGLTSARREMVLAVTGAFSSSPGVLGSITWEEITR